jgi:hypothetical protein
MTDGDDVETRNAAALQRISSTERVEIQQSPAGRFNTNRIAGIQASIISAVQERNYVIETEDCISSLLYRQRREWHPGQSRLY